ncbi:Protein CBG00361 [Caenorhabditis briggsae]|uniref:Protein CBG00361 n=2 Tax=Caenorhabditis briggsae TaxID=6238 RepID=A8WMW9_CAEBR|nr:Protein CBG00361 [Caenorhabditis briggsae]ULT93043.1 hypothetical protein L3Y34_002909 [Caenorhabditis briggsae]CAP21824.1 Protein CBG00361 [Caenorhabditis briggsae]
MEREAPYFGMYGNNYMSPQYIVTSPTPSYLVHSGYPESINSSSISPSSSSESQASNYYQIQPPAPGEIVIVRTTTVTRNTTSIQLVNSTF